MWGFSFQRENFSEEKAAHLIRDILHLSSSDLQFSRNKETLHHAAVMSSFLEISAMAGRRKNRKPFSSVGKMPLCSRRREAQRRVRGCCCCLSHGQPAMAQLVRSMGPLGEAAVGSCGRWWQELKSRSSCKVLQALCLQWQYVEVCVTVPFYVPGAFGGLVGSQRFPLDCLTWSFLCYLEILLHLNDSKSFKMLLNSTSLLG